MADTTVARLLMFLGKGCDLVYYVYVDDHIDTPFRSPVAAELRVKELLRSGEDAYVVFDEGAC